MIKRRNFLATLGAALVPTTLLAFGNSAKNNPRLVAFIETDSQAGPLGIVEGGTPDDREFFHKEYNDYLCPIRKRPGYIPSAYDKRQAKMARDEARYYYFVDTDADEKAFIHAMTKYEAKR